jgi:hypothetical protein
MAFVFGVPNKVLTGVLLEYSEVITLSFFFLWPLTLTVLDAFLDPVRGGKVMKELLLRLECESGEKLGREFGLKLRMAEAITLRLPEVPDSKLPR